MGFVPLLEIADRPLWLPFGWTFEIAAEETGLQLDWRIS